MTVVSFGIEFTANEPAQKLAELVAFSEKNGLEYAWITDHYNNRDSFSLLAHIASKTNTIKLGPGVTNPYTRTAPQLASAIATLYELSEGRAVFGIGPGDKVTFDSIGIEWKKPVGTVKETVEIIRELLSGKKVSYEGHIYNIKSAKLGFSKDFKIPFYIGAQGQKMLALAGSMGDGVLVNASHPLDFSKALPILKEGGADMSHFDVGAYTSFSVAENRANALKAAKPVVAFIVAGSPDTVFERHGIDMKSVEAVRDGFKKGFAQAVGAVTDDMLDAFSICGTPHECMDRIGELVNAGVTQIIPGSPLGPDRVEAIKIVGTKIIPYFCNQG